MQRLKKYVPYILIASLFVIAIWLCYKIYSSNRHSNYLKVVFLNVGQGDSIYIEAPNGRQMLIDGGPDASLLASLAKVMPFADRSIDMIVVSHPDSDHIGGFPILLDNYKVTSIIENGGTSDSKVYASLEDKIVKDKVKKIIAKKGMHIILDDKKNIYFDILFPDRDISKMDSNEGSIVGKLVYGDESFMFTGDAPVYTENLLEWSVSDSALESDVLKLGHHGSRTSSSILWLEKVNPKIAIISAGKDNQYGHPHKELLDRLSTLHIPFLSTAEKGNIIFETDGVRPVY